MSRVLEGVVALIAPFIGSSKAGTKVPIQLKAINI
jgi:hypothetical protein